MENKILIIGKNSFIGRNLYNISKKKRLTKIISFYQFMKIDFNKLSKFNFIINCASNKSYVNKKYQEINDFDLRIAKKIRHLVTIFTFISTRKVYKRGYNISEKSLTGPIDNYSKNKLITENKLKKLLNKKLLILRLSNVIGLRNNNTNRLHNTFIDNFFMNIKKGIVFKVGVEFKDFLGIKQLSRILDKIIEKKLTGTYNVSLGKKVYLKDIINWLNYYNLSKYKYAKLNKNLNNDSFTLNNEKLLKAIKYKIKKKDLEKECKLISKMYFKKK